MFQWHGGGLPSVYRVLRQRFWTCGAKQLSGVVFIIKFDQRLFLPLTLITFQGGLEGSGGLRGPPKLRPHAGRWRAAFIISHHDKQALYCYKAVSRRLTEPLKTGWVERKWDIPNDSCTMDCCWIARCDDALQLLLLLLLLLFRCFPYQEA